LKGRYFHIKVAVVCPFQSKVLRHYNSCWGPLKARFLHINVAVGVFLKASSLHITTGVGDLFESKKYYITVVAGVPLKARYTLQLLLVPL